MSRPRRRLANRIGRFFWEQEKVILALLAVAIVVSGSFWYRQFSEADTGPNQGGNYIEGVVADKKDFQMIINKMTRIGLFKITPTGELENQLLEKWSVNEEKNKYTFVLKEDVPPEEIRSVINQSSDMLSQAVATVEGDRTIAVSLPQPNPNLPLLLSRPLFEFGPYRITKATKKTTVLSRNTRPKSQSCYLNKIIIHVYQNVEELTEAFSGKRIDGGINPSTVPPEEYSSQELVYPRFYAVFFNLNQSPFRDPNFRFNLVNGNRLSGSFTLIVADKEPYKSLAVKQQQIWEEQGLTVNLDIKPFEEVSEKIVTSRSFQAYLGGIDYGVEYDPYYLWHSSQIRPPHNNISGLKDPTVDQLLDKIRSTVVPKERSEYIKTLHATLTENAYALILQQQSDQFYLKDDVKWVQPYLPISPNDRFLEIGFWYQK